MPGNTSGATISGMDLPTATNRRAHYDTLPAAIRVGVEFHLGNPVASFSSRDNGFSPGVAGRLVLADGTRAFVKAVGPDVNPHSAGIHRAEGRIAARLPASPLLPHYLGTVEHNGWVVLLFEDVPGDNPALPWHTPDLHRVLDAVAELSTLHTPSPIDAPAAADELRTTFTGWRTLAATSASWLDPWVAENLDLLARLESGSPQALRGDSLLHLDIRSDNVVLTADRVVFVDWPWACTGPAWVDLICFLPSVAMHGDHDPDPLFRTHPLGRDADPAAVDAVLAGFAGFMTAEAAEPPPPGLLTLRSFQAAQGVAATNWLRRRLS